MDIKQPFRSNTLNESNIIDNNNLDKRMNGEIKVTNQSIFESYPSKFK